jgi:hypothetical protein
VTPIMPANTATPMAWRISAPAPVEVTSGSTPMMKASEVIRIGRRRSRLASIAACTGVRPGELQLAREFHDQDRVLGRESHQHHQADLREDVVVAAESQTPVIAASRPIGTIR